MTDDEPAPGQTEHVATDDHLRSRLRAVERALTDGADPTPAALPDAAEAATERDALRGRVDDLEKRVAELEAATEALRGYAAGVRAVNEEVERRADLALATAQTARNDAAQVADDDTLASLLPDDPAVAAAVPDPPEHAGNPGRTPGASDRDGQAADGRPDGSARRSWGDEALSRLRDAL